VIGMTPTGLDRLGTGLRSGRITAIELARQALDLAIENRHGGMVLVTEEIAMAAAARADHEIKAGLDRGPLHGIPVALKDVIDVNGLPTRLGTVGYRHQTPASDAPVWRALRTGGAVLIGKTRLPDLALGVVTPGVVNPAAPGRVAGGSSGGSAAVVAAGVVPVALGTDTGGSIRIPAALTGMAGLRPTLGALSTNGVAPLSPSQDAVGILAADALDCWRVFHFLRGDAPQALDGPATVWVPAQLWQGQVSDDVAASFARACQLLSDAGQRVVGCCLPSAAMTPAISYLLLLAEAARQWPMPEHPGTLSDNASRELVVGRRVTPVEYGGARKLATDIRQEVLRLLGGDPGVIVLPTTAATAVKPGEAVVVRDATTETVAAAYCRFTALASVTGLPAITVPGPMGRSGLPVGIQFIAAPGAESMLCQLASRFQAVAQGAPGQPRIALQPPGAGFRKSLMSQV
jgi:Asp-tRNA(Asn)/Glu-tRNA(Gln) amidotransferase A subunit family amidase